MATDEPLHILAGLREQLRKTIAIVKMSDSLLEDIPPGISQAQINKARKDNQKIHKREAEERAYYQNALRQWETAKANGIVEKLKNEKNKD
jgi:uncharacterized protein YjiS (DUF1127 family)